ncbi:MAG TPA: hypothetical protein VNG12_07800 [Acidimicrobiales bacterium]|nr:hypothetical protein [Acidimicrobiales bacterium]
MVVVGVVVVVVGVHEKFHGVAATNGGAGVLVAVGAGGPATDGAGEPVAAGLTATACGVLGVEALGPAGELPVAAWFDVESDGEFPVRSTVPVRCDFVPAASPAV